MQKKLFHKGLRKMTWFAASVLVAIRKTTEPNGPWLVYENIILVEAVNSEEASAVASGIARAEVEIDDGFTIDDVPAIKTFAGIRKLINVSNPYPMDQDKDRPVTGTEITYSLYKIENASDLEKLATGREVAVQYVE
jgi:hypothetical protein